jgi:hypothetical protein
MKKIAVYTIIFLPPIFVFYYVSKFGITIPFWDQWELVPLLEKMHNNTLTLADLWAQHNEHRILFPEILMLLLARWSNWNISLELYTNIVLAFFIFLFLLFILQDTLRIVPAWLKIFISLMVFSTAQYENWAWGWQIQMFMSVLGSVAAIWAVNKWQGKAGGLIIAISAAVLSSYSFGTGLLTWPAVLVVMLMQKKWKLHHIAILFLVCVVTVLLYFHSYTRCRSERFIFFFLRHPFLYIRYILTYLGMSLRFSDSSSFITALIILALILWAIFSIWKSDKQKLSGLAPWLALALYVCMAACVTGTGRLLSGWQAAAHSRYITLSSLLPISTAVLLRCSAKFCPQITQKKLLGNAFFTTALVSAFLISYINCYRSGIQIMKGRSEYINAAAFCLTEPQAADDNALQRLYPHPDVVRPRIKTLLELNIKFKTK